jgi:hypothetical protein
LDFIESGFEKHHPNYTAYHTFQVDGIVDMMLYLQYYLKSARTNYNDTYKAINEEATVAVISFFWNEAERALIRAYPYYEEAINSNGQSSFFQTHDDYISGLEILKAVYSSEALIELDKLGIDHRTYDDWNSSYLLFDSE